MSKFDPAKLMRLAIQVMKESIEEPRSDGKTCPKVGAVIWKPDGTVETACRGELRHGDHAEFTLLERKNRSSKLDGSILFATLEPCAPGARKEPKLGCAERIFLARVKEVWVGIEDPDPTVARKGIKYLQDKGVVVHMFDPELQDQIKAANVQFLKEAHQRAAEAERQEEPITLSPLEARFGTATLESLSPTALEEFRAAMDIRGGVGSTEFNVALAHLDLLQATNREYVPSGFGFLLFGRAPRAHGLLQAGVLATIIYPDGTSELRDFDGPLVSIPNEVMTWLRDKLPNPVGRSEARRRELNDTLFTLVREAVVNALVHRDYGIEGAKCQLIVSPSRIVVKSPGKPVPPVTLDQLKALNAPMLSRNPVLHFVFNRMGLAEERGLGLYSMRETAHKAGLPRPSFAWEDPYLMLTLYRNAEAVAEELTGEAGLELNPQDQAALAFIASRPSTSRKEFADEMGLDTRTAQRQLKRLVSAGLVATEGAGPATTYVVRR